MANIVLSATDAFQKLLDGHERFRGSLSAPAARPAEARTLPGPQRPFAAILCCADSRVPPELLFDQDLGDLFVVRVAGNIVTPTQLGSLEFAVSQLGTRLIAVLGHSGCGAVSAAVADTQPDAPELTPGLRSLVDVIRPSVEAVSSELPTGTTREEWVAQTVRVNVKASMADLEKSELVSGLVANDGLRIVGGEYDLASGRVDFFARPDELADLAAG